MAFNYFDTTHAIQEHDSIIDKSGGLMGVSKPEQLDSVIAFVQHDDIIPNLLIRLFIYFMALTKGIALLTEIKEHPLL